MREKIAKDEKNQEEHVKKVKPVQEKEVSKEIKLEKKLDSESVEPVVLEEKQPFKFPIDFEESDFAPTRLSRQQNNYVKEHNVEKKVMNNSSLQDNSGREKAHNIEKGELKVSELYKDKKNEDKKAEKRFRATPIISPIYGVVDKNYDPNDVENNKGRNFETNRPSKNVDFDSVRKKAYGSVADEIKENLLCENCEYLKEARECKGKKARANDDNCYREEYQNITLDEATENYYDYGVAYEKQPVKNEVVNDEDQYYLDEEEDNDMIAVHDYSEDSEPVKKNDIPPVKSSINLLSTLKKSMGDEEAPKEKNLELTDDLFNLIDSMYDERNDG